MPTTFVLVDTNSDLTSQGTVHNKKALAAGEGGTSLDIALAGGASGSAAWYTEPSVPNLTTWPAGDYTLSANIDATGADITYTMLLRRVNSSGVSQQTIGSVLGPLSGTGLKTHTVNVASPITTNAGDRLVGVITASRGASHGNQTLTISVNGANDNLIGAWSEAPAEITGTGDLASQASTGDGDGVSSSTGTGALAAQATAIDGDGVSSSTGAGELLAQASTVDGAGSVGDVEITGTGALIGQTSGADGAGTSSSPGTGALQASAATVDGAGASSSTGTGALTSAASVVAGSAETTITGDGDLVAGAVAIDGSGASASIGAGELLGQASTLDGSGVSASTGVGVVVASPVTVSGEGVSSSSGSGALAAQSALVRGREALLAAARRGSIWLGNKIGI